MAVQFDFFTAQTLNAAVSLAIALAMVVVASTQKTYPGFRRWALGSTLYALGNMVYIWRMVMPDPIAILLANVLYFSFTPLVNDGILSFYSVRGARAWRIANGAVFAFSVVALTVALMAGSSRATYVVLGAGVCMVMELMGLVVLVGQLRRSFSAALLLIVIVTLSFAIIMLARIVIVLFVPDLAPAVISVQGLAVVTSIVTVGWVAAAHGLFAINSRRITDELIAASHELSRKALTDALTDLPNRRGFLEQGGMLVALAVRGERPISVMMIDVDHFKRVNDTYGHLIGDDVLRAVGQAIAGALRASDLAGRMGGEEFGVVMPDTDLDHAETVAERVRAAVAGVVVGTVTGISASIGVATREAMETDIAQVLRRADDAVYRAKRGGRNRSVAALMN